MADDDRRNMIAIGHLFRWPKKGKVYVNANMNANLLFYIYIYIYIYCIILCLDILLFLLLRWLSGYKASLKDQIGLSDYASSKWKFLCKRVFLDSQICLQKFSLRQKIVARLIKTQTYWSAWIFASRFENPKTPFYTGIFILLKHIW